jgi:hypothetical protein
MKDLIAKGRDEANYNEGQHVNRRYAGLEALLGGTAKARNARIADLGTENIPISGIWHEGRDWHFSKAFLMTASIGLDDPKMRTYLLYGSLMSYEERADLPYCRGSWGRKTATTLKSWRGSWPTTG